MRQRPSLPRRPRALAAVTALGALAAALAAAAPSRADCAPVTHLATCVEADGFWPHAGAGRFAFVGAPDTVAAGRVGFGLATTYLRRPIALRAPTADPSGTDVPAVDHQVDATFLWAVGLTDRLEVSAAVPTSLYRSGTGVSAFTSQQATSIGRTAAHDLRFGLTYAWLPRAHAAEGFALASRLEATAPVGDRDAFAGDRGWVVAPSVAADVRVADLVTLGAEVGARLRAVTDVAGSRVGSQGYVAIGAALDLVGDHLGVALEAYALPTLVAQASLDRSPTTQALVESPSSRNLVAAEWMGSVSNASALDGDLLVSLGAGTGLPLTDPASLGTPHWRALVSVRYAPVAHAAAHPR